MSTVSELISSNISNAQRNIETWGGIIYNVKDYRAKGDGSTDDIAAISLCSNSAPIGSTIVFPQGVYCVSRPIILSPGIIYDFGNATIKAIDNMESIITTDINTRHEKDSVYGGTLDCNGKADRGIWIKYFAEFSVTATKIENPSFAHIQMGSNGSIYNSYGFKLTGIVADRQRPIPQPVGSIGLYLERATDGFVLNSIFIGTETGVKCSSGAGGNTFENVHVWSRLPENVLTDGFVIETSDNTFVQCVADTPRRYGFHIKNWRNVFVACKLWNNSAGVNSVVGFRVDDTAHDCSFTSNIFSAASSSVSIAKDFEFENTNIIENINQSIIGSVWSFCKTQTQYSVTGISYPDNSINLDIPFKRNGLPVWQIRNYKNGDFAIAERNVDGSFLRDAIKFTKSEGLCVLGGTGVVVPSYPSLPTASSSYRGAMIRVLDDTNGDKLYFCIKNSSGFFWKQVTLA